MKRKDFVEHIKNQICSAFPEWAKANAFSVESYYYWSWNIIKIKESQRVSKTLVKYFDKLVEDLKNTSKKNLSTPCSLCEVEKLSPVEQQAEAWKAISEFLKIAHVRDVHGIRNAYVSFSRARKQKLVRSSENPDGARNGRPNLYNSESYRYVINRAVKLKRNQGSKK